MECEPDVVSGHVSRFEAPFLRKFFSFLNLPLQSVALFPYSDSILLLLLSHLIFDLSATRFVLCSHLHLSVLCVFGCPLLGSSCTFSRPSLNRLCHSKTLDFFTAYSSYVTVNRAKVSLALLLIFTKNLMFIRCSRFLALIFPPTVYHGHLLLPLLLGNQRLIWSVTHVNAS